jgi:hypothetical protein
MHLKDNSAILHISKALRFDGGITLPHDGYDASVRVGPHVRVFEPFSAAGLVVKEAAAATRR